MRNLNQFQNADFKAWMADVIQEAYDRGFANGRTTGYEQGIVIGYALAMDQAKAAVSDGLRHGSSECGRSMRLRRKS